MVRVALRVVHVGPGLRWAEVVVLQRLLTAQVEENGSMVAVVGPPLKLVLDWCLSPGCLWPQPG